MDMMRLLVQVTYMHLPSQLGHAYSQVGESEHVP
jgi:hypothetical protein